MIASFSNLLITVADNTDLISGVTGLEKTTKKYIFNKSLYGFEVGV